MCLISLADKIAFACTFLTYSSQLWIIWMPIFFIFGLVKENFDKISRNFPDNNLTNYLFSVEHLTNKSDTYYPKSSEITPLWLKNEKRCITPPPPLQHNVNLRTPTLLPVSCIPPFAPKTSKSCITPWGYHRAFRVLPGDFRLGTGTAFGTSFGLVNAPGRSRRRRCQKMVY